MHQIVQLCENVIYISWPIYLIFIHHATVFPSPCHSLAVTDASVTDVWHLGTFCTLIPKKRQFSLKLNDSVLWIPLFLCFLTVLNMPTRKFIMQNHVQMISFWKTIQKMFNFFCIVAITGGGSVKYRICSEKAVGGNEGGSGSSDSTDSLCQCSSDALHELQWNDCIKPPAVTQQGMCCEVPEGLQRYRGAG